MPFGFSDIQLQSPGHLLLIVLAATIASIGCLLLFILIRRAARQRYFKRRDQRVLFVQKNWERIISGELPHWRWFHDRLDRSIVEEMLLDRLDAAPDEEASQLQQFVCSSGLFAKRVRDAGSRRGWAKRHALLALGRMRLPEGIPTLAAAMKDPDEETVVDAIRGLGQIGTLEAAGAILSGMSSRKIQCPPQTLQTALVGCYRADPSALLERALKADDDQRPMLTRALAEVASRHLSGDMLTLAADRLAEVRASAARVIAVARPHYALDVLLLLVGDEEWFVRLRAVVAMGELLERRSIPILIRALCDSNRFVRLRAASALVGFQGEEERILRLAMETGDSYANQAIVSEMERSGRIPELVDGLSDAGHRPIIEPTLLAALRNGSMRILTDLLLHHPKRLVRAHLAHLLARSGETALLQHLEQVDLPMANRQQQRRLLWVISRLRESVESIKGAKVEVAV